jgi:hypothetical protein
MKKESTIFSVIAAMLAIASGAIVLESAYREPYAIVTMHDAYVQLVASSVVVVGWCEIVLVGSWRVRCGNLPRTVIVFAALAGALSMWLLIRCQLEYVFDVANFATNGCHRSL